MKKKRKKGKEQPRYIMVPTQPEEEIEEEEPIDQELRIKLTRDNIEVSREESATFMLEGVPFTKTIQVLPSTATGRVVAKDEKIVAVCSFDHPDGEKLLSKGEYHECACCHEIACAAHSNPVARQKKDETIFVCDVCFPFAKPRVKRQRLLCNAANVLIRLLDIVTIGTMTKLERYIEPNYETALKKSFQTMKEAMQNESQEE